MSIHRADQPLPCPHCSQLLEQADEYVVPGTSGPQSRSAESAMCGYCEGRFTAEMMADGTIQVEKCHAVFLSPREQHGPR